MILLPINIDNKYDHLIDFESQREINDSFIIKSNGQGSIFDFYHKFEINHNINVGNTNIPQLGGILLISGSSKQNKFLHINAIKTEQIEGNYNVYITLSEQQQGQGVTNDGDAIKYNNLSLTYNNINTATTVSVTFEYAGNTKCVIFHLVPANQIWKAVIDSGSESTQIKVFSPTGEGNRIDISSYIWGLRGFKENDITHYRLNNNDIIQVEKRGNNFNRTLYKSIYYIKKAISNNEIAPESLVPQRCGQTFNDPIRMFTLTSDFTNDAFRENYVKLGNLKIASFGGVELPNIKLNGHSVPADKVGDNYYYRKYMGEFCHHILDYIKTAANANDTRKYLSLYVLVPNVYSTQKIRKNLDCIIEAIENILAQQENKYISGFSITAVSESDASIIGSIGQLNEKPTNSNCLIMDAGKGTLDFSLVNIDEQDKFTNISKNGIIGAAAAINYGFILDLLCAYYKEIGITLSKDELKEKIENGILGRGNSAVAGAGAGDVALLNKLMNAVDNYKIRYSTLQPANDTHITTVSNAQDNSFSLAAFTQWIESSRCKIHDNYVKGIMNEIVGNCIDKIDKSTKINKTEINYVLYAGRGFLYKDFKKAMHKALKEQYSAIKEIQMDNAPFDTDLLKTMCLDIASVIDEGRYNPYSFPEEQPVTEDNQSNFITAIKKFIPSSIKDIFGVNDNDGMKPKKVVNEPRKNYKEIKIEVRPNSKLQIGATYYDLRNFAEGDASLFISNENIYLRDSQGNVRIITEIQSNDRVNALVFPSLFPDVNAQTAIYMPNPVIATEPVNNSTVNSGTTQPVNNSGATQPANNSGTTQPVNNSGATQPVNNSGATQPANNSGTTQPANNSSATQPVNNSGATQPVNNSSATQPVNNSGTTQPANNSGTKKNVGNNDFSDLDDFFGN